MTTPQQPVPAPPAPEHLSGARRYRDALVARPLGYRPLSLDLVVPEGPAAPLVIAVYGGAFATGSRRHSEAGQHLVDTLVPQGFAVARVEHRHSREAPFPAQLHDVKAAVRWLRVHAATLGVDPARFAAWGTSSGGHLATMLAVTPGRHEGDLGVTGVSGAVRAAVAWNAPVDLGHLPPPPPESAFHATGNDPHDWLAPTPEAKAAASTHTHVRSDAAPLFLAHGERDFAIPVEQAELLAAAYRRAGAHVELVRVPGADHFFTDAVRDDLTGRATRFLRAHLA
ncbi:alpha/beta hydrolase [Actinosynnema sp. NPDC020468]|uniref:alpha/beta hydrolase n=1 Tax=Actinosynnema sp. NPDC020468 TaxID=3154488 RepID=UPI00340C4E6C